MSAIRRYSTLLKRYGWFDINLWLDVRGNHDSFVQYSEPHPFKTHTVYGSANMSSVYEKVFQTESGPLRFIGIDANQLSLRHFSGCLTIDQLDALESMLKENSYVFFFPLTISIPTILFSHYPIFTMDQRARSTSGLTLMNLIQRYRPLYYLCGHMHSALGGMIVCLLSFFHRDASIQHHRGGAV